ncbi:MAG: hypothetical protein J0G36_17370 [Afipia sp.]|nr:hypothetical protein [Afipia sp.]
MAIKDLGLDNVFYRGVPWLDRPTQLRDLSYPPPEFAKLNRASREGQSMFYASRGALPVFFEIRAAKGQRIALSRWSMTETVWMHHLGFHPEALRRLGAKPLALRDALSNPFPIETSRNEQLRKRLSLAFTNDTLGREYRYKLSVAINELLFDKASPIPLVPNGPKSEYVSGTVYPAMQMRGAADNVAIWPAAADQCLTLDWVRYVEIERASQDGLSYSLLSLAEGRAAPGGEIAWRDLDRPEINRRAFVGYEHGSWVSRDGMGRPFDYH